MKLFALQDEQMMVDVHFLTGTETTGFNLHINGEGAGAASCKIWGSLPNRTRPDIRLSRCQVPDPFEREGFEIRTGIWQTQDRLAG